ncbi:hypothetical protein KHC23_18795 [Ancylobacter dichloromethanicus]|uniref:hypothetical protein n=1 Tax=Ancylobacter dichloromethanicus TaxID=518825 RepID=UPI001BCD52D8|nr:hypothetical protein [Ancylobacter dichloromethanicus]MBS7555683.1 hypothetical protein [Ancylobacter dichloromethanicus]
MARLEKKHASPPGAFLPAERPSARRFSTKSGVERTVKGLLAAGIAEERIVGVRVTDEGFVVMLGEPQSTDVEKNEWDEVLTK